MNDFLCVCVSALLGQILLLFVVCCFIVLDIDIASAYCLKFLLFL